MANFDFDFEKGGEDDKTGRTLRSTNDKAVCIVGLRHAVNAVSTLFRSVAPPGEKAPHTVLYLKNI